MLFIPFGLWLCVIFILSSETYQEQSIQSNLHRYVSEETVRNLLPDLTIHYRTSVISSKREPFLFVEFLFRKAAHIFTYGLLAILLYLALIPYKLRKVSKVLIILVVVTMIAGTDEWNQSRTAFRTAAIQDVGIDFAGGVIALGMLLFVVSLVRRKEAEKK